LTIFEKIVAGDIPAYKVAENDDFLAFLDVFPIAEGHTLVIPKKPTDYIFDIEEQEYIGLHLFAKKVALAIDKVMPCVRVGSAVVGLEVPHAHIHLIPINEIGDISFQKEKLQLSPTKMQEIANSISEAFSQL
jgi:histidine triad (HIT) family protein